jgi:hypothetical protein
MSGLFWIDRHFVVSEPFSKSSDLLDPSMTVQFSRGGAAEQM